LLILETEGFCNELVKPFGPIQEYLTPGVDEFAVSFKVLPGHNGLLLPAVGVEGTDGFTNVMGPTILEGHPLYVALILL
jgi:hypothetical protein